MGLEILVEFRILHSILICVVPSNHKKRGSANKFGVRVSWLEIKCYFRIFHPPHLKTIVAVARDVFNISHRKSRNLKMVLRNFSKCIE